MSGKYPLIEDTDRTRTRDTLSTDSLSVSTSDYKTLSTMFPRSPIYVPDANADYRIIAQQALSPKYGEMQGGDVDQFGPNGVDLNYGEAPALPTTQGDFEGNYYPNLVVSGFREDGTSAGSTVTPNDNFGSGLSAGTNSGPKASSDLLSLTDTISAPIDTVGNLLGKSNANPTFPGALGDPRPATT